MNLELFADYHTHTIFSHGKGTIEDNVKAAIKKGLKELAITDHGPAHIRIGLKKNKLKMMRDQIDRVNEKYKDFNVLMGIEANLTSLNGWIDVQDEFIELFDIILMGYHKAVIPVSYKDWTGLFIKNTFLKGIDTYKEEIRESNTEAMIKAIQNYNINIITHPGAKISIDTAKLAREAGKRGTALEINSYHGYLTYDFLKEAMKQDVKFAISSDAHHPKDVGNFEKGILIAQQAGLSADRIINAYKNSTDGVEG